jgi:hypothetical protein
LPSKSCFVSVKLISLFDVFYLSARSEQGGFADTQHQSFEPPRFADGPMNERRVSESRLKSSNVGYSGGS